MVYHYLRRYLRLPDSFGQASAPRPVVDKSPIYRKIRAEVQHEFPKEVGFNHRLKVGWNRQQSVFEVYLKISAPNGLLGAENVQKRIQTAWPEVRFQRWQYLTWQVCFKLPADYCGKLIYRLSEKGKK
jgi:hypothetical protein